MIFIGVDIGGTKCVVNLGLVTKENARVLFKCKSHVTKDDSVSKILDKIVSDIKQCIVIADKEYQEQVSGIGISCGGPLDSDRGIILSPPNLPLWDAVKITEYLEDRTGLKAWLCNDANACALAEWKYGAGKGTSHMIFMTFGTGLGAGIIINDQLYTGASDMAGELGHIRLSDYGPAGYGKMGSFEGFCSGGGIAALAKSIILEKLQSGEKPELCGDISLLDTVTAKKVGEAAKAGDSLALDIWKTVGCQLGKGLSILIDLLNPQVIVIGSIFVRCYDEIWPYAREVIEKEALSRSYRYCKIVPAKLTESVGDIAALTVGEYNWRLHHEGKNK